MNYHVETWYKLYIRESTQDRLLPIFARALRDFILRLAKSRDDGTVLQSTNHPGRDLANALGAHPSERKLVMGYVEAMLADGYLSHENGRLWITNFVAAQNAQTAGAKRQKTYRDKRHGATSDVTPNPNPPVTGDVTHNVTSDVTGDEHVTLLPIRSDPSPSDPRSKPLPLSGSDRSYARDKSPAAAAAAGDENGNPDRPGLVSCPADLKLTADQIATLEVAGVSRDAIPALTGRFVAKHVSDPEDRRPLKVWQRCLVSAVSGAWNDPRTRPKAPGLAEHLERTKTAQRVVSGATRAIMGNLLRDLP